MKLNRLSLSVNLVLKPLSVAGAWYMLHNLHYTLLSPTDSTVVFVADVVFLLLSVIWSYVIMDKLEAHGVWGWVLILGLIMGATYAITAYAEYERAYETALAKNSVYVEAVKRNERTHYSQSQKNKLKKELDLADAKVSAFAAKAKKKLNDFSANYNEAQAEAKLIALKKSNKEAYRDKVDDVSNLGYRLTSPLALARAIEDQEKKRLLGMVRAAEKSESYLELLKNKETAKAVLVAYTPHNIMTKKREYQDIITKQEAKTKQNMLFDLDMLLKIWLSIGIVLEVFGSPLQMWLNLATQNKKKVLVTNSTIADEENRINGLISSLCSLKNMKTLAEKHELYNARGEVQSFYATLFNFLTFAIDKDISFLEVPVKSKSNAEDENFLHGWSIQNAKSQTQKTVKLRDGSVYTPLKSSPAKFTAEIKEMLKNYDHRTINLKDVENLILFKKGQKTA